MIHIEEFETNKLIELMKIFEIFHKLPYPKSNGFASQ